MRDLSDLLIGSGSGDVVIAYRQGQPLRLSQFRTDIAHNATRLRARNCSRGLLITADTYWCAVGMLALFQIGADVILPQNTTSGAGKSIGAAWDLIVTDQPDGEGERFLLGTGATGSVGLCAMDVEATRLSLYTSGSTGLPKRVDKTLAVMQREARAIEEILGSRVPSNARATGMVTHQHLFGLSFKLFWPLFSGRPFEAKVHEFWEELLAEDLAGTAVVVSPAHLKRLGDLAVVGGDVAPACLLSAGAELSETVAGVAQRAFRAPLCEIYGSTETGTIGWRWRERPNAPWMPAPGVEVTLGANSQLQLRSPFLPDADWFRTEDRAEGMAGGGFRLLGRADRIVKIEGKRVSLPEIEAALAESPLVAAVAALALGEGDVKLAAVVVPSAEGSAELARLGAFRFGRVLRQALAARHEAAALPRRWRFASELPVGPLGKTSRDALERLFDDKKTEPDLVAVRRHGDDVELDLFNSADLVQLDGHFPNMPIVPGVAQIDWVVKLAARHLDLPLASAETYQVKFHRLTLPETIVTLVLAHDRERQRLNFTYRRADVVLTSGVIRLAST